MWYNTHVSMNGEMYMSLRFAAGEVFGCIPHGARAYAANCLVTIVVIDFLHRMIAFMGHI